MLPSAADLTSARSRLRQPGAWRLALGLACCACQSAPTDVANPACTPACRAGLTCQQGKCVASTCDQASACPAGWSCAAGFCSDVSCSPPCPTGQTCVDQICLQESSTAVPACAKPYALCESPTTAYCADFASDSSDCGGCGIVCPPGEVCNGQGLCAFQCVASESLCGVRCFDLATDNENCGGCGQRCGAGQVCSGGQCTTSCGPPLSQCGAGAATYCADLQSDPVDCGSCGTTCGPGQICVAATCAVECPAPLLACASTCVDPGYDDLSCGSCGAACAPATRCLQAACVPCGQPGEPCCSGETCAGSEGACVADICQVADGGTADSGVGCVEPLVACDGGCVDPAFDDFNCNSCGTVCGAGTLCLGGACQVPAPLPTPRAGLTVSAGRDGRIYTFGGGNGLGLGSAFSWSLLDYPTVEIYDPSSNTWSSGPDCPLAAEFMSGTVGPDGRLYLAGGFTADGGLPDTVSTLLIFDPDAGGWAEAGPLPESVSGVGLTALDARTLQVAGGFNIDAGSVSAVWLYDLDAGTWTPAPPLPGPRDSFAYLFEAGGTVDLLGGTINYTRAVSTVDTLAAGQSSWAAGISMTQARSRFGGAVGPSGEIYAIGGMNLSGAPLTGVEVLPLGAPAWTAAPALPAPRSNFGAAVGPDGRIYVVGGLTSDGGVAVSLIATVEVYDFQLKSWVP